ncbi:hypothetical protein WBG78_26610 [Chryseolinea sp. T2]|uniref:hypothetical protein n=1 Tax=Chryseolinea sp. T2 TaxID=3129255 RepID=UPI00307857DE
MPRRRPLLPHERPSNGKIVVESATWGRHERAKRGTHKPAPVNQAFNDARARLQLANPFAAVINDAVRPFNRDIKDGTLWSRLTKHFHAFIKEQRPIDFRSVVNEVAIHKEHRLHHTLTFRDVELSKSEEGSHLQMVVQGMTLKFTDAIKTVEAAQATMIGIFIDDRNEFADTRTQVIKLELTDKEARFALPIPLKTATIILCLKCEAITKGFVSGNLRLKGMDFVKAVLTNEIAVSGEVVQGAVAAVREPATPEDNLVALRIEADSNVKPVRQETEPAPFEIDEVVVENVTAEVEPAAVNGRAIQAEGEPVAGEPISFEVQAIPFESESDPIEVAMESVAIDVERLSDDGDPVTVQVNERVSDVREVTSSPVSDNKDTKEKVEEAPNQLSLW